MIEFIINNATAITTLVGIITGGSVVAAYLKLARFYNTSQDSFRDELRKEVKDLRTRVDHYRDQGEKMQKEILEMKEQLIMTKSENDRLRRQIQILIKYLNDEREKNQKNRITYEDLFSVKLTNDD